jgi:hypothetical protein
MKLLQKIHLGFNDSPESFHRTIINTSANAERILSTGSSARAHIIRCLAGVSAFIIKEKMIIWKVARCLISKRSLHG